MNPELSRFAARVRESILVGDDVRSLHSNITNGANNEPPHVGSYGEKFGLLALELFALQFKFNSAYRKICEGRKQTSQTVEHWTQIPAVPTRVFKELELTSLTREERTAVFHSSGTTEQEPSRHFHNAESLAVYEASLWKWFQFHFGDVAEFVFLTPNQDAAPHSSLVHMFETLGQKTGGAGVPAGRGEFFGDVTAAGVWVIHFDSIIKKLKSSVEFGQPLTLFGTAFSFVHLLDYLAENNLRFELPNGSSVMETGGYKNRSRTMPKTELHALITDLLGVTPDNIICEYGMSELSSQAYAGVRRAPNAAMFNMPATPDCAEWSGESLSLRSGRARSGSNVFRFPPWARVQIVSPETGREVAEGETGLIRVFDLANVFSVAAVQTEDLGIRLGNGFELIGRAPQTEPRGCSLMTA